MIFFAQKAFVVEDERLLMLRKSPASPMHANKWEVPGGRLEPHESIEEHIIREVFEETGIEIEPGKVFALWDWPIPSPESPMTQDRVVAVARLGRRIAGAISTARQMSDDHIGIVQWVPLSELATLDIIPNMRSTMLEFIRIYRRQSVK